MAKIQIKNYTFDASAKTVTFTDYAIGGIDINSLLQISNVSQTNSPIIYSFAPTFLDGLDRSGTVAGNVLTLAYDTTAMADSDDLQIWYWDADINEPVDVQNFPAEYPLPTAQATALTPPAAISNYAEETGGNLAAIKAKTDNIPASPATEGGNLATIAGKDFSTQATLAAVLAKITSDPATQTTLAAILAKIIASPATEATLAAILAALGSPFQAGGSIGNSVFGASQSGAWNVTADTELPPAAALADATANPTIPSIGTFVHAFNGTTWDRLRTSGDNSDANATATTGHQHVLSHLLGFNGTTWDRLRTTIANGLAVDVTRVGGVVQIKPKLLEVTGSSGTAGTDIIAAQDVSDYKSGSVQLTGTFTGAAVSVQVSNDNVTFNSIAVKAVGDTTQTSVTAFGAAALYAFPIPSVKYLKVRLSGVSSGTISAILELSTTPYSPHVINTESNIMVGGTDVVSGNGVTGAGSPRVTIVSDNTDIPVKAKPQTSGGVTPYVLISAATTNATSVKGSAGNVYGITVSNINAAVRYLKLYNKASAPTVGTDTPVKVIMIPGSTTGGGNNITLTDIGVTFSLGIAFAITTGAAHTDTGAVAANEIIVNLDYN